MLGSSKKPLSSEDSSEYNSLFIINNDLNDLLNNGEDTAIQPEALASRSLNFPRPSSTLIIPNSFDVAPSLKAPSKVPLKKHAGFTTGSALFDQSHITYQSASHIYVKASANEKPKPVGTMSSERYNFQDSNSMLESLKKKVQEKMTLVSELVSEPPLLEKKSPCLIFRETQEDEKTKETLSQKPSNEDQVGSPNFKKSGSRNPEKDSGEKLDKTQGDSNVERNLKDSTTFDQSETFKEEKGLTENIAEKTLIENIAEKTLTENIAEKPLTESITEKNEVEGLDTYFEGHAFCLAKMKLPVNPSFLKKRQQNEVLWTNCIEVMSLEDKTEVLVKINISKEVQTPFELKVKNATELIKAKRKYDWQFGGLIEDSSYNGVMVSAMDRITGLNFNLLMLNFEKLSLIQFYEDLYRILLLYYLGSRSEKPKSFMTISDIYYTEHLGILENEKKFMLWVVFEPFEMKLERIIRLREEKKSYLGAAELINIYGDFLADIVALRDEFGIVFGFVENEIFYSHADHRLKLIDLSFFFQIKNRIPHAMTTLNVLVEKLKKITDFNEDFRAEAFLKVLRPHPDKALFDVKVLSPGLRRGPEAKLEELLADVLNADRNEENELCFHAKLLKNCFCYKSSNETYKKLLRKYALSGKSDFEVKYKIGVNFFLMGAFEKAKCLLAFVREAFVKYLDKYLKKVITISLIFALVSKTEGDLETASKHFEEVLTLLKKHGSLGAALKKKIHFLFGFCNGSMANNLSNLRKAFKLFSEAMQMKDGTNHQEDIINSLAILSATLGNHEQSLEFFKQISPDQTSETVSFPRDSLSLEKRIILLSNKALVHMEVKDYPEARRLLTEATLISESSKKRKPELGIRLLMHSGVLHEKMSNYYEAMREFKLALQLFKQAFPKSKRCNNDLKRLLFGIWTNMAGIYLKFGDYAKSQKYLDKCASILAEFDVSGEKMSAAFLAQNQGILNQALGKTEEAVNDVEGSLKIKRKFFEESSLTIFNALKLLLRLHLANGNKEKAAECAEKVVEMSKKMLGGNSKDMYVFLMEIFEAFERGNEIDEGVKYLEMASGYIEAEQITDSTRIEFYVKLATIYETCKNWEKNIEANEKLLSIYGKNKGENLRILIELNSKVVELCRKTKKDELLKKYQMELESLSVLENNKNLLRKVGGKLVVALKGVKAPRKVIPQPKP